MKKLTEYLMITLGTLITAMGIYFFKFPNNFSIGGVSGISVILGTLVPGISSGGFVLVINTALLVLGFLFFGKSFGVRTVYSSLLLSLAIFIMEKAVPMTSPMTSQPLLELVFAVVLPAAGSALLFHFQASSGGTDIIAMLLRKYTSVDIGRALLFTDLLITLAAGVVFGIETGLFSLLGLFGKSIVIDNIMETLNMSKYFTIITSKPQEITRFINENLHRGATICSCAGAFTHQSRGMILTVLARSQAIVLKRYIQLTDPHAFVVVTNTSRVIGKGFRDTL